MSNLDCFHCGGGHPSDSCARGAMKKALAPWIAACDAVGVPHNPDALIRHHRNNAAAAAQLDALTAATDEEQR